MEIDLKIISNSYLDYELPKEHSFLFKYFKSEPQIVFLKYYITFGGHNTRSMFIHHTGIYVSKRYLFRLIARYNTLIEAYNQAKENMDFDLLWQIENGKFKVK